MSGFGKRIDVPGGRRRAKREEVRILGSAISLDGSKSVIVEDLCPSGAKIVGRGLPQPGHDVVIRAGSLDAFGHVAWADQDNRGIIFEIPQETAFGGPKQHGS
jgi:hypothetical protein